MPSAMSRPREPVETASVASPRSRLPLVSTEPLPNARSIWLSAASSARLRSEFCSLATTRKAACAMRYLLRYSTAPADPQANPAAGGGNKSTRFVLFGKILAKVLFLRDNTIYCSWDVPRTPGHCLSLNFLGPFCANLSCLSEVSGYETHPDPPPFFPVAFC